MLPHVVPSGVAVPSGTAHRLATPARPVVPWSGGRREPVPSSRSGQPVDGSGRPGRRWRALQPFGLRGRRDAGLAVLDASSDAVLGVDAGGRTAFANLAATSLFGVPVDTLVGRPSHDLVPELASAVDEARRRALAGVPTDPRSEGLDLYARTAAGEEVPVTAWLTPMSGPRGRFVVAATLHDLRPQHEVDDLCLRLDDEARGARAVVDAVLRTASDRVIVLADADGCITKVNRATEKLLGYRCDELVGRSTTRLSDARDIAEVALELGVPAGVDPLLELARWGLPNRQDWDYVTKEGRRRPVSLTVTAIGQRETPQGFVCVASDRTVEWQQVQPRRPTGERLLLDLDDAATRVLRWGVGRSRTGA